jgi:hypothetical protein
MKALLLFFAGCAAAAAQSGGPWSIKSATLDGGGASSTGGGWKMTGTIGQPDAATPPATGGTWAVAGGFWPGMAAGPAGPRLTIYPNDAARVVIGWNAGAVGYKLQYSTAMGTWLDYPGVTISRAASLVWPLATGPRYFFRLKKL